MKAVSGLPSSSAGHVAIEAGTVVDRIAGAIDLLPTLAELAGIPYTTVHPIDGLSLKPLLEPGSRAAARWPDRHLVNHWRGRTSVRGQQHRLDHEGRLFDIAADPGQRHDVAAERPEVAAGSPPSATPGSPKCCPSFRTRTTGRFRSAIPNTNPPISPLATGRPSAASSGRTAIRTTPTSRTGPVPETRSPGTSKCSPTAASRSSRTPPAPRTTSALWSNCGSAIRH